MKQAHFMILIMGVLFLSLTNGPVDSLYRPGWKQIGKIKPRHAREIVSSGWAIGGETLDRNFADYHQYKSYLGALGVKLIRLQGGWARTEKEKGKYDWAWLDSVIEDAVAQGVGPWLQASYGNSIYPGGGGTSLSGGLPTSPEALAAWDNWVEAMVKRYGDQVKAWEVWNEPNFGGPERNKDYIHPEQYAAFFIRTAAIIRKHLPDATIFAVALGHMELHYIDRFLAAVQREGKLSLISEITYHDYVHNPDSHYGDVEKMREIIRKYSGKITIRQGENGAPSVGGGFGALTEHPWTEVTQAKWDLRRMLGDHGRGIPTSVFSMVDMVYPDRINNKGIIKARPDRTVERPKVAYHAIRHVTSIFDGTLHRIPDYPYQTHPQIDTLAVFGYRQEKTKNQVVSVWFTGSAPREHYPSVPVDLTFSNGKFQQPVLVDLISGNVFELPRESWKKKGDTYTFLRIPVYDSPVLIADKSILAIE